MEERERKRQLEKEYLNFLETAKDEELDVLQLTLDGIKKKKNNEVVTYLNGLTNLTSKRLDNGALEMSIPNTPLIKNPLGIAHGGITATLLDTTLGTLANLQLPENKTVVTTELKINYLRPGDGEFLRCVATLLHAGSKIAVLEGKVYNDREQLIAHGSGSFFIVNREKNAY